ncbi:kinase-like domain-containing protein [Syncephalis plumigaleata]|nr:kinase-like domain-containing protein [Syncephalis plumigaleata]
MDAATIPALFDGDKTPNNPNSTAHSEEHARTPSVKYQKKPFDHDTFSLYARQPPEAHFLGRYINTDTYSLTLDRFLGRGAYGEVYRARCLSTGQMFAVKAMKASVLTPGVKRQVEREVHLQYQCADHPGVLKVYGLVIVSESCNYSDNGKQLINKCSSSHLALPQKVATSMAPSDVSFMESYPFPTYTATDASVSSGWYILLEYCDGGDLFSYITRNTVTARPDREDSAYNVDNGMLSETVSRRIFVAVLEAIQWCHQRGIAHRDLKPENILLKRRHRSATPVEKTVYVNTDFHESPIIDFDYWNDMSDTSHGAPFDIDEWEVKIADFGLATDQEYSNELGCGSMFYMSPECHPSSDNWPYSTQACDVWSAGILLINLLRQVNPWRRAHKNDAGYKYYITHPHKALRVLTGISREVNTLLIHALHPDATCRCSINDLIILTHDIWPSYSNGHYLVPSVTTAEQQGSVAHEHDGVKQMAEETRNGSRPSFRLPREHLPSDVEAKPSDSSHHVQASVEKRVVEVSHKKCVTTLAGSGKSRVQCDEALTSVQNNDKSSMRDPIPNIHTTFHNTQVAQTMHLQQICRLSFISEVSHESSSTLVVVQALQANQPRKPEEKVVPTPVKDTIVNKNRSLHPQHIFKPKPIEKQVHHHVGMLDKEKTSHALSISKKIASKKSRVFFFRNNNINDTTAGVGKPSMTHGSMHTSNTSKKAYHSRVPVIELLNPSNILRRIFRRKIKYGNPSQKMIESRSSSNNSSSYSTNICMAQV